MTGIIPGNYPKPNKHTKYRIEGPNELHGMLVWIVRNPWTQEQVGLPCFSKEEAIDRVKDLLAGRKIFFMGRPFERFKKGE